VLDAEAGDSSTFACGRNATPIAARTALATHRRFRGKCGLYTRRAATVNLHEYQAKDLFRSYGIPVPPGRIAASPEAMWLCAQTTNSYRRLVPGYEAPINLVYSQRNRSACCRIPMYSPNPRAKRVEFRSPDPSCNPYLAFAAMLMAGLDGINNRIDPGSPIDKNLYDLPPAEAKEVKSTPGSLDQALDALERDHKFLLRGDVFTADVIETWLDYKRKKEVDAIRLRPHPYEFHLYYDI